MGLFFLFEKGIMCSVKRYRFKIMALSRSVVQLYACPTTPCRSPTPARHPHTHILLTSLIHVEFTVLLDCNRVCRNFEDIKERRSALKICNPFQICMCPYSFFFLRRLHYVVWWSSPFFPSQPLSHVLIVSLSPSSKQTGSTKMLSWQARL